MTPADTVTHLDHFRDRRRLRARHQRIVNNLPMAHRLAASRACDAQHTARLMGQAMVGLVEAADRYEREALDCRFGAYAAPMIAFALERSPDAGEITAAQAETAAALATEDRVRQLAGFLDLPVSTLVGGLMDAVAQEPSLIRRTPVRGVA